MTRDMPEPAPGREQPLTVPLVPWVGHLHGCALPSRGGACDCPPPWSRGFTYQQGEDE